MLVVIVIGGYTLSSVLAFDGTTKQSTAHPITEQVPIPPLHTKIEDHVAYGVKNIRTNLVRFMQDGLEHTPSKN